MPIVHTHVRRLRAMFIYGSLGMFVLVMSVTFIEMATDLAGDLAGRIVAGLVCAGLMAVLMVVMFLDMLGTRMSEPRYVPPELKPDPVRSAEPDPEPNSPRNAEQAPDAPPVSLDEFTREYGRSRNGPDYPA